MWVPLGEPAPQRRETGELISHKLDSAGMYAGGVDFTWSGRGCLLVEAPLNLDQRT